MLCSKCKAPHFPPTGRACQKLESALIPDLSAPHTDLSSTLANTVEQLPVTSPTLSPVRRDPETQAALDMLQQQAYLIANSSPTQAQESAPVTPDLNLPANQAQLINNLLQRFGQNTRSAPVVTSPVGQAQPIQPPSVNIPGPSTQSAPVPHSLRPPHNPNSQIQDALELMNRNIQRVSDRQDELIEKERIRAARESNSPAAVNVPQANTFVFF